MFKNIPFLPIYFCKTSIFEILVAGPTNRNISAAPGARPFAINAAAIGVVALAHTYIGIPTNNIASFAQNSSNSRNKSTGIKKSIHAPSNIPTNNQLLMSSSKSTNPNLTAFLNLELRPLNSDSELAFDLWQQLVLTVSVSLYSKSLKRIERDQQWTPI